MATIEISIKDSLVDRLEKMAHEQRRSVADEAALMVERAVEQAVWMDEYQSNVAKQQGLAPAPMPSLPSLWGR